MFKSIGYFPAQCARGSENVLSAFLTGCKTLGIVPKENDLTADAFVIWSVVTKGRMADNLPIYRANINHKPIFILEVGALIRGTTWKVALNHINNTGNYGTGKVDRSHLKLGLNPQSAGDAILVALQQQFSLLWNSPLSVRDWAIEQISQVRRYYDCPIVVRYHPRDQYLSIPGVIMQCAELLNNTYCEYDIGFNYKCIINHSSGVGVQSIIAGTPVICDTSSLAYSVSTEMQTIMLPDRTRWFDDILHTEWLVDEIATGMPLKRILDSL